MTGKTGPLLAVLTMLVAFFSAVTPARATSDGLIAHWQFDETSGTTAADSKGGNDGTLVNGPVWQPTSGKIGGALSFDGVDDEVDTGTIPGLAADSGNPFTFSFWYKAAPGANNDLFGWSAYRSCRTGFVAEHMACTVDSSSDAVISTTNVNDNNWHHIAYTYTNAIQYLYVDGNAEDSSSETISTGNPTYGIIIGSRNFGDHIQAQFDDVRVYNRALSAAEVLELYNTKYCAAPVRPEGVMFYNACCKTYQFCNGTDWINIGASPPQCTNTSFASALVAHWKLDETSGTTATDSVGSNDGTLTNGPTWTTGNIGGAVQFDGTNDYIGGTLPGYDWQAAGLTLSLWVKDWPSADQDDAIIELWDSSDTNRRLRISTDNFVPYQRYQIQAGRQFSAREVEIHHPGSTAITNISAWKHLVVTLSPTAGIFYLDGVEVASDTAVTAFGTVNLNSFRIGGGATDYNGSALATYESATVDDVRIYDRALSAAEVAQLYNGMDWVTTGPDPCGCDPSPGDVCADGSFYIGEHDGHRIYAAATDQPTLLQWSSEAGINTGAISPDDGLSNTNILVGLAGSYPAAEACRALGNEWYLPAPNELRLIWDELTEAQRIAMGINITGDWSAGWYWSSSENDSWYVSDQAFHDGTIAGHGRAASLAVRCVRR